ncbi:FAD-binding protein [Shewanella sp. CG12_big_fil_rev_8_21_14_0_65_47_15]|uniref:FAD-binding protein n=1 Tax=Shewanella sp. CG12_big_fil_rev_8_21_14_0_65_47_15 TaxID=1975537 RepID=UPI000CAD5A0A|nr:FAD-binding protein [Shewanella sp. CG12_big_fil_rev_8_21_14_0_65_47_15]PIW59485.1 MAG: hypothetical protein COW15_17800 [Shewanella sp. CG12_big_fil_rev_8_21_14_0_65_47_15]
MLDHEFKYDYVISSNQDDYNTWHLFSGFCANAFGGMLLKEAEKKGVNILYETPGKSLIVEDGVIKGVKAVNVDNEEINIYSKSVIIATGGYGNNVNMMERLGIKNAKDYYVRGNHNKTGDGLNMAFSVNAASDGLGVPFAFFSTPPDEKIPYLSAMWAIGQGYYLKATSEGKRFENEMLSSHWSDELRILMREKTSYHYVIFDSIVIEKIKNCGSVINTFMPTLGKISEIYSLLQEGEKKDMFLKQIL